MMLCPTPLANGLLLVSNCPPTDPYCDILPLAHHLPPQIQMAAGGIQNLPTTEV